MGSMNGQGVTLVSAAARTTSSNSGNLKDTSINLGACKAASIWVVVTANAGTGGANTAWVEIETSHDGGTTWLPGYRFTQITTSTATHRLDVRTNGLGANEAAAQASGIQTQTAALTQNCVLSRDTRVVWTLGNAGQTLTFGVFANIQPNG